MKPEIVRTKKPKIILQVFHNFVLYHKDQKSFSDRQELTAWQKEIYSTSAYLNDNKLILSKSDYNQDFINCDLIIINDFNCESELEAIKIQDSRWQKDLINFERKADGQWKMDLKKVQYLRLDGSKRKFEIFRIMRNEDKIEIHLLYNYFEIGQPKRENFKLCNLENNVPVEIKINGKLDHSLSSGRERSYKEHSYIFHLIGQVSEFELKRDPLEGNFKQIPIPEKVVDLMKQLY